jgi:hypothetical protein
MQAGRQGGACRLWFMQRVHITELGIVANQTNTNTVCIHHQSSKANENNSCTYVITDAQLWCFSVVLPHMGMLWKVLDRHDANWCMYFLEFLLQMGSR